MSTKKTEGNNENVGGGEPEGYVYERDTWPVIDRCFEDQPNFLAHNQLDSFNDLIESTIPVLIKKDCPIVIESGWNPDTSTHQIRYEVDFTNVYMSHPQINEGSGTVRALHPHEARHRNLTYSANLYIDVTHRLYKDGKLIDQKTESKIQFKIPAMVKSKICYLEKTEAQSLISMGECPYDKGGYFIINGSEKVIISQERPVDNKILCFSQKTGAKYDEIVEIRSTIDQRFYPVKNNIICLTRTKDGEIEQYLRFGCPYLTKEVSLIMMFKAIGITSEKEICEMICMMDVNTVPDDIAQLVTPSLEEMIDIDGTKRKIITQHDALVYISRHVNINMDYLVKKLGKNPTEQDKLLERNRYILDILRRDLLPHVGPDFRKKGLFLGYMAQRLIQVKLGSRLRDIRDHYANKRLDTPGPKLKQLFHGSFGRLIKEIKNRVGKALENNETNSVNNSLRKIIQNCTIEAPIKKALSTGDWSTNKNANFQSTTNLGIAQVLNRMSYIGYLSHIRRAMTPMEKAGGKITEPRKLHPSQNGYICPNETPEGQQVGIVKNLALMTTITIATSVEALRMILNKLGIQSIDVIDITKMGILTKVFLNGEWMGVTTDALKVYNRLKELKRGRINPYMGIFWDHEQSEINIRTDGGRYTRPLYIVERYGNQWWPKIAMDWKSKNLANMSWSDLVGNGYIEYIDPEECENCLIAMSYEMLRANRADAERFHAYTHLEIHCSMWHGVVSQIIPLPDHNQSPRNCFMCLWKEEKVLMADNNLKKIGDIKIGEKVWCVDPDTLDVKKTTVVNQFVKNTDKNIIEISSISGRKLVCTDDHPILTSKGWKKSGELTTEDLISINVPKINYNHIVDNKNIILDINNFQEICTYLLIKPSLIKKHCNDLISKNILPLYNNNSKLPILAKILGYGLTDGSSAVYNSQPQLQMTFGNKNSSLEFNEDVTILGFNKNKIIECSSTFDGYTHNCFQVIYNNSLASLMLALGLINGKKTIKESKMPDWIKNGSKLVKREFLSAFQGGDGAKIRYSFSNNRKSPIITIPATGKTKNKEHLQSLFDFFTDLKSLFEEFDIKINNIDTCPDRKYEDRFTIKLNFNNSRENIINYFERIGYSYDDYKYIESLPVYEYLKYIQHTIDLINELKTNIKKYREEDKINYPEIGKKLGISASKASDLYRGRNSNTRLPNNNIKIHSWLEKIVNKNKMLFVPFKEYKFHTNVEISDITVDSECHSFITGSGIVVHNSSMGKQALGLYATNFNSRFDTMANVLCYPNKPLVNTRTAKYVNLDKLPHGQQCVVAVACYTGYNQEDSVLMNKASIERGKFNSIYYKTYVDEMNPHKSSTSESEQFGIPNPNTTQGRKHGSYDKLDETGFAKIGAEVEQDDVIIGKTVKLREPVKTSSGVYITHSDISSTVKQGDSGFVDLRIPSPGSVKNLNSDNNQFSKVRLAQYRRPVIGDKLASRSAQKATIGLILEEENMPFTDTGIVPDIVMNPHALPSRMTIAQTLECILGKNAALDAEFKDATPFTHFNQAEVGDALEKYGFERDGEEVLYNGMTGEQLRVTLFIGPTYYQRLKHMVQDKVHARSTGRVNNLTKQSVEGRGVGGGLRFGEMERDCLISHGTSQFQKERFMDSADKFRIYVGKKNHSIVVGNPDIDLYKFDNEDLNPEEVSEVQLPHAMKLLIHELMSMGTDIQMITDEDYK